MLNSVSGTCGGTLILIRIAKRLVICLLTMSGFVFGIFCALSPRASKARRMICFFIDSGRPLGCSILCPERVVAL